MRGVKRSRRQAKCRRKWALWPGHPVNRAAFNLKRAQHSCGKSFERGAVGVRLMRIASIRV